MTAKDVANAMEKAGYSFGGKEPHRIVQSWVAKKAYLPNVIGGYAIARALGATIEELVDGAEGLEYVRELIAKEGRLWEPPERLRAIVQALDGLTDYDLRMVEKMITALQYEPPAETPVFPLYTNNPEPEYEPEEIEKAVFVEDIAAGPPRYQSDDQSMTIDVPKQLIKTKIEDYYVGRVNGTSMTSAGIPDGVLVLIRKSDTPQDGAIQVVECRGEATLKRLREIPGKGWNICFEDNTGRYIEIGPGDEYEIQGDFVAVLQESDNKS